MDMNSQARELLKGVAAAAAKVGPARRAFLNPGRIIARIDRILFEESRKNRGVYFYKVEMTVAKQLLQTAPVFPDHTLPNGKVISGRSDPLNHDGQQVIYQLNRTWENFDEKLARFLIRATGSAAAEIDDADSINAMRSVSDGGLVGAFVEIEIKAEVITPKDKNELPYPWSTIEFVGPVSPERVVTYASNPNDKERLTALVAGK